MTGLLGPDGSPIEWYKKTKAPKMGPAYGHWANREMTYMSMPGGQVLQFDLSLLNLADYRVMRYHPQINASLSVLTFMIHQIDWHIECEDKKIEAQLQANMEDVWTRLVRAMSQAFWAGYSPNALEYENNKQYIEITKIKDLYPEDCTVNWKEVDGAHKQGEVPPKYYIYDGIRQAGLREPIPLENTFWYPFMMENGGYNGRPILKPAFTPWYFSILMHLFANRYYERFGEPVPIGRYPEEGDVDMGGTTPVTGKQAMDTILASLRNRSVVSLPSVRDPVTKEFDYLIEYLESDMRGIDFERYLTRLDEEISLALFTPILLFKSGDVGSNNLGVQHTQTFMWQINAIVGDMREYMERYLLNRLRDFNWGPNAARPYFRWKKLGIENQETVRAIISALITGGTATVDLEELGSFVGMTVKEVRQVTDPSDPPEKDDREVRDKPSEPRKGVGEPRATGRQISARVRGQITKAWANGTIDSLVADYGFSKRMISSFMSEGMSADAAESATRQVFTRMDLVMSDLTASSNEFNSAADLCSLFDRHLEAAIDDVATS